MFSKRTAVAVSIMIFVSIFASGCAKVPPQHVGVEVKKTGSSAGVHPTPLGVGYHFYFMPTTEIIVFPIYRQSEKWTKNPTEGSKNDDSFDFSSSEGANFNADVSIEYQIDPAKADRKSVV